eukprot:CAMPEP_0201566160 /NCGR_PEP_ID=MMETSP0190_2-20130828/5727_1 /ASSEMBLY_ACC=CAM_ASM_000263 /TAXON_ID=37353 /ORGANISM="Rosalina sp." /LENGTH=109 /DNA_ID=CAMNT_0047984465 /DNA_START=146 /DNA_END=472 /DNA_ORIENTATION=-
MDFIGDGGDIDPVLLASVSLRFRVGFVSGSMEDVEVVVFVLILISDGGSKSIGTVSVLLSLIFVSVGLDGCDDLVGVRFAIEAILLAMDAIISEDWCWSKVTDGSSRRL